MLLDLLEGREVLPAREIAGFPVLVRVLVDLAAQPQQERNRQRLGRESVRVPDAVEDDEG
ncbi:hypothetical protein ACIQOW_19040 [Kitasatospora sp. NPDC091335]|uniref:hypothetical protein n=1 Tax=Kitasatospora sp. NPDC091335 TaxID=3364085 RepID=UPI003811EADE